MLSQTDQLGRTTSFAYDGLGRRTSVTDPLGNVTSFSFDAAGNLLSVTDPLLQVTQYTYDNLYRRTSTTDALSGVTSFAFDAVGNLLSLTDPVNNTTSWVYDALNRVAEETNELSFTRYFVYDAAGNLTRRTDRNGRAIEYTYDNLYRRTQENWLDEYGGNERTLDFSFDVAGQLVEAADPAAAYTYTHDNLGRIVSIGQTYAGLSVPLQFTQQFDAVGNRTQLAAAIGETADFVNDYQFDALRRMTRVTQHDVGYASSVPVAEKRVDLAYNALGQFAGITRYADLAATVLVTNSTFDYDTNARLTSLAHTRADDTSINTYTWTYDSLSRITSQGSSDGSSTYTYDQTSQLVAADHNFQADEDYQYDANGNRTSTGYETGANNQLLSDGTFTYQYDAEGNRTTRTRICNDPADDYLTEYTWDHRNRLASVTLKNDSDEVTGRVEYDYDVYNLMVARREYADESSTPVKSQHFIYDGSQITLVFDDPDFSGSQPFALRSRLLLGPAVDQIFAAEDALGEVIWPLADHLNTARDFVDSSGVLLNHRQFDSFGNLTAESNPLTAESNPTATNYHFTFTGGYQDPLTGLIYRWHRWYDTESGGWASEDPIEFTAMDPNLRRYVGNDPINWLDPSGLEEETHINTPPRETGHRSGSNPEAHSAAAHARKQQQENTERRLRQEAANRAVISNRKDVADAIEQLQCENKTAERKILKGVSNQSELAADVARNNAAIKLLKELEVSANDIKNVEKLTPEAMDKLVKRGWKFKKIASLVPFVGIVIAIVAFPGKVEAKGFEGACIDEALDNIPFVEYAKGGYELLSGEDLVPDKDPYVEAIKEAGRRQYMEELERLKKSGALEPRGSHFGPSPGPTLDELRRLAELINAQQNANN